MRHPISILAALAFAVLLAAQAAPVSAIDENSGGEVLAEAEPAAPAAPAEPAAPVAPAAAAGPTDGNFGGEVIAEGETIQRDLFMAGEDVAVDGVVDGDVVAAGRSVTVGGEIGGDLWAAGQTIRVSGKVADDMRVAGQNIRLDGEVGSDLLAFGERVEVGSGAVVGGEVSAAAQTLKVQGRVGSIHGDLESLTVDGVVDGDVDVTAASVTIGANARIAGALHYHSTNTAEIAPAAVIGGEVKQTIPPPRPPDVEIDEGPTFISGGKVLRFIAFCLAGIVLLALAPGTMQTGVHRLSGSTVKSLLVGFLVTAAGPVAVIILVVTLVGIPLALVLLTLYLALLYLAGVIPALLLGRLVLRQTGPAAGGRLLVQFLVGALLLAVLALLPWVGGWIKFAWMLLGSGALSLALLDSYGHARRSPI